MADRTKFSIARVFAMTGLASVLILLAWAARDATQHPRLGRYTDITLADAAGLGDIELVKELLHFGIDIEYTNGARALNSAINPYDVMIKSEKRLEIIRVLLEGGVDPNLADGRGIAPTKLVVGKSMATGDFAPKAMKLLVEHGADVGPQEAIVLGDVAALDAFLVADPSLATKQFTFVTPEPQLLHGGGTLVRRELPLLTLAAAQDDPLVVKLLLEFGADPSAADILGLTPLYYALDFPKPNESVVAALLEAGADPNQPNDDGWTPFMWACLNAPPPIVRTLLDYGADPNRANRYPDSLLVMAISSNPSAVSALLEAGADPNTKHAFGSPPLFYTHDLEVARLLVEHGADVNATGRLGDTYLHEALKSTEEVGKSFALAEFYLSQGGNFHARNAEGLTAVDLYYLPRDRKRWNDLIEKFDLRVDAETAIALERYGRAAKLIESDPNLATSAALAAAIRKGHAQLARPIMESGVDLNDVIVHDYGAGPVSSSPILSSAFHLASQKPAMAEGLLGELLDKGLDPNLFAGRSSALMSAIMANRPDLVQLLLEHGADPNVQGEELMLQARRQSERPGRANFVQLLKDHGAREFGDVDIISLSEENPDDDAAQR